jgi:hypothetical protein
MSTNASKASTDMPILREFADRLLWLVDQITQPPLTYKEDDHLGFMTLCFVSKQVEHLRSICVLIDAGRDRDAGLVARAMLEGLGLLLWASSQPVTRPLRWRGYAWVEDWRLVQKRELSGEQVDPTWKSRIDQELKALGPIMYSENANKCLRAGKPLPDDPYMKWTDVKAGKVLAEVGAMRLYKTIYRDTSGWGHWNVAAIGRAIERSDGGVRYSETNPEMAAVALAAGFQALFESASQLDQHFTRGFASRLVQLRDAYLTQLGTD